MDGAARFVRIDQFTEEFVQELIVYYVIDTFCFVNYLFNETLLDSHDAPVLYLRRRIDEQAMDHEAQYMIDLQMISQHLLLAVRH